MTTTRTRPEIALRVAPPLPPLYFPLPDSYQSRYFDRKNMSLFIITVIFQKLLLTAEAVETFCRGKLQTQRSVLKYHASITSGDVMHHKIKKAYSGDSYNDINWNYCSTSWKN
ncbi:hypothetical protein NPIL_453971 [Nephila pilipes]|uniref:Uncharacterized protein n=1 Tax=Nephila pilipes TaxID=299642 RepID=A0A8X6NLB0_NEPPI|nr:hypothetical protein NPIL_453971 [Nephila pilipes]